jgi:glycosyltransferase involved in cell wall biosynthesis
MRKSFKIPGVLTALLCAGAVAVWFFCKAPKVSIVMPVYNGMEWLDRTVGFLLVSDFTDFEFIMIDDGSSDGSYEKLLEFAAADGRVKVYKNETNMGIAKTRNRGMALARGKYIAPMDQDDWSLPGRLGAEVAYLDAHPDVAAVDVGTILMRKYYQGIRKARAGAISYLFDSDEQEAALLTAEERDENIRLSLFFSCAVPTQSAMMLRKDYLTEHQIAYHEDIRYADDYRLFVDLVKSGAKFHHIPEVLHVYNDMREHSTAFVERQAWESNEVKQELFNWAGLTFDDYKDMDVKEFVCSFLRDMLALPSEKRKFPTPLLAKDYRLLCETETPKAE